MSLQQQILLEMQEEEKIDKKITRCLRNFFKERRNRNYKLVSKDKTYHAYLIFDRKNLESYLFSLYLGEEKQKLGIYENSPDHTIYYLQNRNPKDAKQSSRGVLRTNYQQIKPKTGLKILIL